MAKNKKGFWLVKIGSDEHPATMGDIKATQKIFDDLFQKAKLNEPVLVAGHLVKPEFVTLPD